MQKSEFDHTDTARRTEFSKPQSAQRTQRNHKILSSVFSVRSVVKHILDLTLSVASSIHLYNLYKGNTG